MRKPLSTPLVPSGAVTAVGRPCGHFMGVIAWLVRGSCGIG